MLHSPLFTLTLLAIMLSNIPTVIGQAVHVMPGTIKVTVFIAAKEGKLAKTKM